MGNVQIPGRYSGRSYNIKLAGDAPTPDEQARATQIINQREEEFRQQFEADNGPVDAFEDDGTALGRSWDRGKTNAYEQLGTAARYAGDESGWDWLENKGRSMEDAASIEQLRENTNLPAPMTSSDVKGFNSLLSYTGEALGGSAPQMMAAMGASAAAAVMAPASLGVAGAGALSVGAGALANSPFFAGANIQRQEAANGTVDPVKLAIATVGQSVVSSVASG